MDLPNQQHIHLLLLLLLLPLLLLLLLKLLQRLKTSCCCRPQQLLAVQQLTPSAGHEEQRVIQNVLPMQTMGCLQSCCSLLRYTLFLQMV
jgi:hypothetical protein